MKILDCTLRDGGYYTNWHFKKETIENYLIAMESSEVDYIEIGLRTPAKNSFLGPFAYCSDDFLKSLPIPKKSKIAVMINAKDYIKNEEINSSLLNDTFSSKDKSCVSLVRIAAHYSEVSYLSEMFGLLDKKGYAVAINLMQTGSKSKEEITTAIRSLSHLNLVALYFADSFGDMDQNKVVDTIKIFKECWNKEIGIHAHNNMGMALKNTLTAYENGASFLDCTVMGMGRGAGNTQTEYLLLEANKITSSYSPSAIFPLVLKDFKELHNKYQWGPSLLYYLSAQYSIHPTYIQEILSTDQTTTNIITALENLRMANASSYSREKLNNAFKFNFSNSTGSWTPESLLCEKDILILGSGPSVKNHAEAIKNYILTKKPFVISLNYTKEIDEDLIDVYAACHPIKLLSQVELYKTTKTPLMIPFNSLDEDLQEKLSGIEILDYGITGADSIFKFDKNYCELPKPIAFAYAIAAASSGKANRILAAGFDGYIKGDQRQDEMEEILTTYFDTKDSIEIISITPTSYEKMSQSTVYNMNL